MQEAARKLLLGNWKTLRMIEPELESAGASGW
jgi:hypothetical protein